MTHLKIEEDAIDQEKLDEIIYDSILDVVRHARESGWNEDEIKQAFKEAISITDME